VGRSASGALSPTAVLLALALALADCGGERAAPDPDALVRAAERGDVRAVRDLLASGADVDARDARGRTAVTAAALADHVEVARLLVRAGADVDLQDGDRNNPVLVTGETGSVAMLRAILPARPDLTRTNRFGGVAHIPASERGHVGVVRELLRAGIAVDHVNRLGWTALLEAVMLGDGGPRHQEIVRLLLAAGADPSKPDGDGVTPLEHAQRRGYAAIARMLERAGGDE
jgi:hypothetical protein